MVLHRVQELKRQQQQSHTLLDKDRSCGAGNFIEWMLPSNMNSINYFSGEQAHVPAVLNWVVHNITQLRLVPDNNNNKYSCLQGSSAYSSIPHFYFVVQSLKCVCNFPFSGNPYFSNGCVGLKSFYSDSGVVVVLVVGEGMDK
ncbi:hypothetical protein ACSBR2_012529 [Camellia fascicularis]